ncbi:MAG: DUF1080 domain-containing protein [Opitutaceae bacterium]
MRTPIFLALSFALRALQAETPKQPASLYNGKDLAAWRYVTPGKESISEICHLKPDGVLAIDGKPNGYIATSASYENYRLHVEWRWSGKPGNAGVLVHITEGPMDRIWPISFQIQTKNTRVGDVLPMSLAKFAEPPTTGMTPDQLGRTGADQEKPVGLWNSCDIICRGDTIEVTINGVAQNKVTKCIPAAGKIGFQLEGVPYELRNIRIEPLKPAIGSSGQTNPAF